MKPEPKVIIFIFLLAIVIKRKIKLNDPAPIILIVVLSLLYLFQYLEFGVGYWMNYFSYIIIIGNAYFALKILQENLMDYFIWVVRDFAVISLAFWIISNLVPAFYNMSADFAFMLGTDPTEPIESFIIYAYEPGRSVFEIIRNNGGFWEPGVYAVWLSLALLFSVHKYGFKNPKSNIITLALITTFSTAGYLALFCIILFQTLQSSIRTDIKTVFTVVLLTLLSYGFFNLDFLNDKIIVQFQEASSLSLDNQTTGRIFSARKSMYSLSENPFLGKGLAKKENEEIDTFQKDAGTYGIFVLFQNIGIVFSFIYLFYMFKTLKTNFITIKNPTILILALLSIFINLFSQTMYDEPVYLAFLLSGMLGVRLYQPLKSLDV